MKTILFFLSEYNILTKSGLSLLRSFLQAQEFVDYEFG
jgi:hypothetical protein